VLFLRPLALPTALLAGLAGTFVATGPASANADAVNLIVEVLADRNILSTSGWSSVDVHIRNEGTVPAAGVTVWLRSWKRGPDWRHFWAQGGVLLHDQCA
jgi:hypothetical protein